MATFHSRFGPDVAAANDEMKSAFMQHISEPTNVYVFATGPLRQKYYTDGGKTAPHAHADATLSEIARDTSAPIELVYLSNAQEAKYGFDTMLEHSKEILDDAITKARVTEDIVGVVHSGTTSFQVGEYNRTTGMVSNLNSFDYGTNNPNESAFQDLCTWFSVSSAQHFFSFGSESYAAPSGKIATTRPEMGNDILSDLDHTARAFGAARRTMNAVNDIGKTYFIPERKAWEAKTSATLALRKQYPTGTLLDWGGGQVKNEETGLKVNFDQRVLFV